MLSISKCEPEKIDMLPDDIQKLVWRAFFYLSQIENYLNKRSFRRDESPIKKFYKYCNALENLERIIEKKCEKKGIDKVVLFYKWQKLKY